MEDEPYPCQVCGKRFIDRLNWRQHQKIHPVAASDKQQPPERSHLKETKQIVSNRKEPVIRVKTHACKTCGKAFTDQNNLRQHEKTHSVNVENQVKHFFVHPGENLCLFSQKD